MITHPKNFFVFQFSATKDKVQKFGKKIKFSEKYRKTLYSHVGGERDRQRERERKKVFFIISKTQKRTLNLLWASHPIDVKNNFLMV